jgi:hypothetical protein
MGGGLVHQGVGDRRRRSRMTLGRPVPARPDAERAVPETIAAAASCFPAPPLRRASSCSFVGSPPVSVTFSQGPVTPDTQACDMRADNRREGPVERLGRVEGDHDGLVSRRMDGGLGTKKGRPVWVALAFESNVRARLMKSAPRREGIGVCTGNALRAGRPVTDHERVRRRLRRTDRPSEGGCGEGVEGACHRGNSYLAFARVTESFTDCKRLTQSCCTPSRRAWLRSAGRC